MGSAYVSGSPDLDTRPPETQRAAIFTWVQRCSTCGYCASDVSKSQPVAEEVIKRAEYRRHLRDETYPDLANSFLCKAIIDRAANDYSAATWSLIQAAWACDDEDCATEAETCRSNAADMLMIAEDHGQSVGQGDGASTAILVDLLRRSGRAAKARMVIIEQHGKIADEVIVGVLEYQQILIEQGDTYRHTIAEAFGQEEVEDIDDEEDDRIPYRGSIDLVIAGSKDTENEERDTISFDIPSYRSDMTLTAYYDKWRNRQIIIPEFRRDDVWDEIRASKLIESFLLGLPTPHLFLYQEHTTDRLLVVEGQQLILSVVRFLRGRFDDRLFRLRNVAPRWEGRSFRDLSEYDQVRLRSTVLHTTIVQQPDKDDSTTVYYLFERLNSGGVRRSPMEIRRRVYTGDYFRLLEKLNGHGSWRVIVGNDRYDRRLLDVELILRFFAMRDRWKTYEKPMASFLNTFITSKLQIERDDLEEAERVFDWTCTEIVRQLGKAPFHLRRKGLSIGLIDSVMVMISLSEDTGIMDFRKRYDTLRSDKTYMRSVTSVNDTLAVRRRFELAQQIMLGIGSKS